MSTASGKVAKYVAPERRMRVQWQNDPNDVRYNRFPAAPDRSWACIIAFSTEDTVQLCGHTLTEVNQGKCTMQTRSNPNGCPPYRRFTITSPGFKNLFGGTQSDRDYTKAPALWKDTCVCMEGWETSTKLRYDASQYLKFTQALQYEGGKGTTHAKDVLHGIQEPRYAESPPPAKRPRFSGTITEIDPPSERDTDVMKRILEAIPCPTRRSKFIVEVNPPDDQQEEESATENTNRGN